MKKKMRTNTSNITPEVAAIIKGMVARGDRQMDVAIWAGCNQGRVCEIVKGTRFGRHFLNVDPAPIEKLPEPGPYVIVSRVTHDRATVAQEVVRELSALLERYKASAM